MRLTLKSGRGDAAAFAERVSPDYRTGPSDKAAFSRAVEIGLGQYRAVTGKPATRLETLADGKRVFVVTQDYEFRPAPEGKMPLPYLAHPVSCFHII